MILQNKFEAIENEKKDWESRDILMHLLLREAKYT
jgi:hypothetical protein